MNHLVGINPEEYFRKIFVVTGQIVLVLVVFDNLEEFIFLALEEWDPVIIHGRFMTPEPQSNICKLICLKRNRIQVLFVLPIWMISKTKIHLMVEYSHMNGFVFKPSIHHFTFSTRWINELPVLVFMVYVFTFLMMVVIFYAFRVNLRSGSVTVQTLLYFIYPVSMIIVFIHLVSSTLQKCVRVLET